MESELSDEELMHLRRWVTDGRAVTLGVNSKTVERLLARCDSLTSRLREAEDTIRSGQDYMRAMESRVIATIDAQSTQLTTYREALERISYLLDGERQPGESPEETMERIARAALSPTPSEEEK